MCGGNFIINMHKSKGRMNNQISVEHLFCRFTLAIVFFESIHRFGARTFQFSTV
jgi:hypothetical protein